MFIKQLWAGMIYVINESNEQFTYFLKLKLDGAKVITSHERDESDFFVFRLESGFDEVIIIKHLQEDNVQLGIETKV